MSACTPTRASEQAQRPAGERQQHALGHELAEEPAAARAERGPHRELPMPRFRARQQQVGEVRARNQQHESDGRLQHPDRAARAADDLVLHGLHLQDVARSGAGGVGGARRRRRREHVLLDADALAPVLDQRGQLRLAPAARRRRPSGGRSGRGSDCRGSGGSRDSGPAAARSAVRLSITSAPGGRMPITSRFTPLTSTVWPTIALAAERRLPQLVGQDGDRRRLRRRRPGRGRRAHARRSRPSRRAGPRPPARRAPGAVRR